MWKCRMSAIAEDNLKELFMADLQRGKQPAQPVSNAISMKDAFGGSLPTVPDVYGWSDAILPQDLNILGNDRYGNCGEAGAMHQLQIWTSAAGDPIEPDLECTLDLYSKVTGFNPVTGANDNGTVLADLLKYWMDTGIPVATNGALHKLGGIVAIQPGNIEELEIAIHYFGGAYVGADMPDSAELATQAGQPWSDLTGQPTGGHCFNLGKGNRSSRMFGGITWGLRQPITYDWWLHYGEEAYALVSFDWLNKLKQTPAGMTMEQLDALATKLGGTLGAYS